LEDDGQQVLSEVLDDLSQIRLAGLHFEGTLANEQNYALLDRAVAIQMETGYANGYVI
jgi:hypothetical protein